MHMYREIFKNDYKHTCIERQYREGDKCLIPVHIRTHTFIYMLCIYTYIYIIVGSMNRGVKMFQSISTVTSPAL